MKRSICRRFITILLLCISTGIQVRGALVPGFDQRFQANGYGATSAGVWDESVSSQDATAVGTFGFTTTPNGSAAVVNTGAGTQMTFTRFTALTDSFTIQVVVRLDSAGTDSRQSPFALDETSGWSGLYMGANAGASSTVRAGNMGGTGGSGTVLSGSTGNSLTNGTWGVYTLVGDPNAANQMSATFKLLTDGSTTFSVTDSVNNNTDPIGGLSLNGRLFGGEMSASTATDEWRGAVADVVVYNSALSQASINSNLAEFQSLYLTEKADPVLSVESPIQLIGSSYSGGAVQRSITISNLGYSETLTLSSVTLGGADAASFTIDSFPSALLPGETGDIALTFMPLAIDSYEATLDISSNSDGSPTTIIQFSIDTTATSEQSPIVISEVMADNDNTLADEDGDASDWIELFNNSDNAVSLTGWHLTDDTNDLTKWTFPVASIEARGFVVVFASDKDRAVAGEELHTNFKLSAAGETVTLVDPNGSDVAHMLSYPELDEDVSYGYVFESSSFEPVVLLDAGASCTALIPTSASDADGWKEAGFNDAGWLTGSTGVGYETGSDPVTSYDNLIGLDVVAMQNVNATAYVRVPFSVTNGTSMASLNLRMKYDDAFVAYINGVQVAASEHAPETLVWDSSALDNHADEDAAKFEDYDISATKGAVQVGANVLAIHGLNKGNNYSDFLILPQLEYRVADGVIDLSTEGLQSTPTPGSINNSVIYEDYVETPVTAPERGFYDISFDVTVSNVTAGATIRYTTDGSTPTASSTEYTGPVTISETTCFRVGAFVEGWRPSYPRTDTYIFVDDVTARSKTTSTINGQSLEYGMDAAVVSTTYMDASNQIVTVQDALKAIPTISITSDYDNLYDPASGIYVNAREHGWEVPASAELINPDGSKGFHMNAGLRIRGGSSRRSERPKHSFRILFRDEYGDGKLNHALFEDEGVDEFKKIDLRTAQNYNWAYEKDSRNTFLRDVFSRDTAGEMGQEYARSRYYHLYLNGEYWGLYMTEERPVADFGASYFAGDSDDYDCVKVIGWPESGVYSIEATDGTLDAYNRLYSAAMAGFTDNVDYFAVQGLDTSGEEDSTEEKLLDVESMIDYLLTIYYMGASDNGITIFISGKVNNIYVLYNRVNPDGFKWMQHDTEHGLDTTTQADMTGPFTQSTYSQSKYFNAQILHQKLSVNEEYKIAFADRVYKHFYNDGALVQTNCEARMDFRAAQIDRAIVANAARWGSTSLDRDTWVSAVATTRSWLSGRADTVIGYLDADGLIPSITPPILSRSGGVVEDGTTVALSASLGTIYYTIDGTDPRAIGGGISGLAYSSAITISRPTHLKARTFDGSEWSALAEDTFWTPEIPLAVTELMYHAPDGNAYDFIEVRNVSDETVTLKGYKLDSAVDFKFKNAAQTSLAPGEYLVAVDDIDVFSSIYSTASINIAGEFSGDFSNGGEKVDLEFRDNDLVSFTYDDARNWPQAADGAGHSLVPLDSAMDDQETGSLDYGGNWRASTFAGGSPGYADPEPSVTVVLNEISAHTDTELDPPYDSNDKIELYNTSASTVTISGWYLSDSLDDPYKWLIPDATIPRNGFVVFDETDFHFSDTNGFGLNKAGEQVILSAPDRVVDAVRFKGQENVDTGVTWGRYPDGHGDWLTTVPTLGSGNEPVSATVRISELMFNPVQAGNDYEYIQIENVGTIAQPFNNATGAYRIDGGVEFTFPAGTILPAGETLWILSFNPTNTVKLDLFCAAYGLNAANEMILGGYSGSLSDRGERVAIERPQDSDDPLKPLDVSWVVVDELFYFDQSPWPNGADGTGYPLIRTGLSSWGAPSETDADADQMDDSWELDFFQSLEQTDSDPDSDGYSNIEEYIADTNPTNGQSYFAIEGMQASTIYWTPIAGRTYSVYWSDDLNVPFSRIASGLPDTQSSYSDSEHFDSPVNYYRIQVEIE